MNNICVVCDKCGNEFNVKNESLKKISRKNITAIYFSCDECGEKYLVSTLNSEMRNLISERESVQQKLKILYNKGVPVGEIQRLQNRLNKIIIRQKKLNAALRKTGIDIINS